MSVGKAISDTVTGIQSDCRNVLASPEEEHDVPLPNQTADRLARSKLESRNTKVFIVHGHDEEAKESAARCVEKLGLEAVILHEQPNRGRTVIEKFEGNADVAFVVVLLTPDDIGGEKDNINELRPRARQNVILELGFFIGQLGRERVCALHKGSVEIPSDISGVLWVPLDPNGAWRISLAKEMKAAGLQVDLNRLG
jgi:predicted nucleotide-binding protein